MYYIYKIAYKISDEIKAQKEAEKPFWWEHLHPEIKVKSIEEVEKELLSGSVDANKLATMSKNEKYLALSESCYMSQCKQAEAVSAELETLKKDVERSKTSFLNQPITSNNQLKEEENLEPIVFGQKPATPNSIPSGTLETVPAAQTDGLPPSGLQTPESSFDAPVSTLENNGLKDNDFGMPNPSGPGSLNDVGSSKPNNMNSAEIRKHAQSIVNKMVHEINASADKIPDDVAVMKEHELLQAVITELQTIK